MFRVPWSYATDFDIVSRALDWMTCTYASELHIGTSEHTHTQTHTRTHMLAAQNLHTCEQNSTFALFIRCWFVSVLESISCWDWGWDACNLPKQRCYCCSARIQSIHRVVKNAGPKCVVHAHTNTHTVCVCVCIYLHICNLVSNSFDGWQAEVCCLYTLYCARISRLAVGWMHIIAGRHFYYCHLACEQRLVPMLLSTSFVRSWYTQR